MLLMQSKSNLVFLNIVASGLGNNREGRGILAEELNGFLVLHDQESTCCSSCDACKNSDESKKIPHERKKSPCASFTCRKHTTLSTVWQGLARVGIPTKMRTIIRQFYDGTCALACEQMMVSNKNKSGLMSLRGCDKAACCRRCYSTCSSLLGYTLFSYFSAKTKPYYDVVHFEEDVL